MFTGITAPSSLLHELIIGIHILYIYLLKTEHMKFLIKQLQIIKEPGVAEIVEALHKADGVTTPLLGMVVPFVAASL